MDDISANIPKPGVMWSNILRCCMIPGDSQMAGIFSTARAPRNSRTEIRDRWISLDDEGFQLLHRAIQGHTKGGCGAEITVQACWDSDRLDLGRAGIIPIPGKLCTSPAREPEVIQLSTDRAIRNWVAKDILAEWGVGWPI